MAVFFKILNICFMETAFASNRSLQHLNALKKLKKKWCTLTITYTILLYGHIAHVHMK